MCEAPTFMEWSTMVVPSYPEGGSHTYLLTDKNLCRCFGAPARRVFPDHLITYLSSVPLLLTGV